MKLKIFVLGAFTRFAFGGNPAALVPLGNSISEGLLQKIAVHMLYFF